MALKDIICGALQKASDALSCTAPVTSIAQKVCPAISAAQAALECNVPGPGESCAITGCDPGMYCSTVTNTCLLKKTSGDTCTLNDECVSGSCLDYICT